jgi:hypothetical protein
LELINAVAVSHLRNDDSTPFCKCPLPQRLARCVANDAPMRYYPRCRPPTAADPQTPEPDDTRSSIWSGGVCSGCSDVVGWLSKGCQSIRWCWLGGCTVRNALLVSPYGVRGFAGDLAPKWTCVASSGIRKPCIRPEQVRRSSGTIDPRRVNGHVQCDENWGHVD